MKLEKDTNYSRKQILTEIGNSATGERFTSFRFASGPILDIRSPVEFEKGHIPGSISLPLFSDEERAKVGICYKKDGKDAAIELGFNLVGARLGGMVRRSRELAPEGTVRIHCARGGLRSRSVAWLLETAGFEVVTLYGGYKSYRRWVSEIVETPRRISLLSGLTGTGKTRILKALKEKDEQVLDLEGLANHRGSSFGGFGMPPQPSTQQFENLIAKELFNHDSVRPVWIEAESRKVGSCWIPEKLFLQMKSATVIGIARPMDERLDLLTEMYGQTDRVKLVEATTRIAKNLGGERTKTAVELINQNEIRAACRLILDYYDRSYNASRKRRPVTIPELDVGQMSDQEVAALLIEKAPALIPKLSGVM